MKKNALIIGGTSGIGLEISKVLVNKGYNLIVLGRNKKKLSIIKKKFLKEHSIKIKILNFNLNNNLAVKRLKKKIIKENYNINFLVYMIGSGIKGDILKIKDKINNEIINSNISIFVNIIKIFFQLFYKKKK